MAGKNIFDNLKKMDTSYLLDPSLGNGVPSDASNEPLDIKLDKLIPFKNHPFRVDIESDKFQELLDSVKEYGVIQPILIRQNEDGVYYEIISGHCRVEAARLVGMECIPAKIMKLDDFTATAFMTHSNIYGRDEILISEKAKAYRMCLDEEKKLGRNRTETAEYIGAGKDSKRQVQRYVRLSYLNDNFLCLIDKGSLSVQAGVELAFLDSESQTVLYDFISKFDLALNFEQAQAIREISNNEGVLSSERLVPLFFNIHDAPPKPKNKVTFKTKELAGYFDEGTTAEVMTDIIKRLLEKYKAGELVLND
jgi:ParB family chromosome partitioning protein